MFSLLNFVLVNLSVSSCQAPCAGSCIHGDEKLGSVQWLRELSTETARGFSEGLSPTAVAGCVSLVRGIIQAFFLDKYQKKKGRKAIIGG